MTDKHCYGLIDVDADAARKTAKTMEPMTFERLHFHIACLIEASEMAGLCPECVAGTLQMFPAIYLQAYNIGKKGETLQ